ncbi:N-acetylmuramoyl-L-alanine amidase, partial [Psychrobacter sp. 1U2]
MAKNITSLTLASVLTSFMTLPLIGCVATSEPRYIIDSETYQATGKSERIKTIVLHYTVSNNERSIKTL